VLCRQEFLFKVESPKSLGNENQDAKGTDLANSVGNAIMAPFDAEPDGTKGAKMAIRPELAGAVNAPHWVYDSQVIVSM
jgi:hypothetical protein